MAGDQIRIDVGAAEAALNDPRVRAALEEIGNQIIEGANRIYESQAKHRSAGPFIYTKSWRKRFDGNDLVIENDDPAAFMTEVGGHAGGKTPVLGYAPVRQSIDLARAKWLGRKGL